MPTSNAESRRSANGEQVNGPGTYYTRRSPRPPVNPCGNQAVSGFRIWRSARAGDRSRDLREYDTSLRASGRPEKRNWLETGVAAVGEVLLTVPRDA